MSQRCDVRIEVPATAHEVALIRRAVLEATKTYGFAPALCDDIGLAVSEACANVVMHAYRDAPAPGPLTVEIYRTNGDFVVVVSDEGLGDRAPHRQPRPRHGPRVDRAARAPARDRHQRRRRRQACDGVRGYPGRLGQQAEFGGARSRLRCAVGSPAWPGRC